MWQWAQRVGAYYEALLPPAAPPPLGFTARTGWGSSSGGVSSSGGGSTRASSSTRTSSSGVVRLRVVFIERRENATRQLLNLHDQLLPACKAWRYGGSDGLEYEAECRAWGGGNVLECAGAEREPGGA